MDYRIYPLENTDRLDEICTLFATGLADTTPDFWKWKHFSDNGMPKGMILVAEAEDGSFAAVFALQPENYVCNGEKTVIIQTEDLVILPAHRGSGLMKKLYFYAKEHYAKEGATALLGFCNDNSYPIFVKYGATDMGDSYSWDSAKSLLPIYLNKKRATHKDWKIEVTDEMPNDLFYLENTESFQMEKNDTFMKWKFVDNPEGPFYWLTIRKNGVLMGYVVYAVTQGRLRRAVNIYDWALNDQVDAAVLKRAVDLLRTHGNWVNLWGRYTDAILDRWAAAGIKNKNEQGTRFILHALTDEPLPENWHLTRADLDY